MNIFYIHKILKDFPIFNIIFPSSAIGVVVVVVVVIARYHTPHAHATEYVPEFIVYYRLYICMYNSRKQSLALSNQLSIQRL